MMETGLDRKNRWMFTIEWIHSMYFLLVFYLFIKISVKSTLLKVVVFSSTAANVSYLGSFLATSL